MPQPRVRGATTVVPAHPGVAALRPAMRRTALVLWVMVVAASLWPLAATHAGRPTSNALGLALVLVHEAAVLLALLGKACSRAVTVATGALLVLGVAVMMPTRSTLDPINQWAPGYWALPWAVLAMLSLRRREYLPSLWLLFPALALLDVLVQVGVGAPLDRFTLEPVPGLLSPVAIALLFFDGLLQLARASDRQQARRRDAERLRDRARLTGDARREAARLLHDHVLHALHALRHVGGQVPAALVVDECRTAVAAVRRGSTPLTATADLTALLLDDPLLARAHVSVTGQGGELPHPVAHALAAAAHEAVDNVERHAHATHCSVTVTRHDGVWECCIRDDGTGFDPAAVAPHRLGLRESITARVQEVGGAVHLRTSPGAGTRIQLRWPAEHPVDPLPLAPGSRRMRRVLTRTAWPNLVLVPVFTALLGPLLTNPWPAVVAAAGLFAVGAHAIRRLGERPPTLLDSALLMATSAAAWATNLWTAPDDVHLVHYLWLAWGCASLAHLVVLQVRLRHGVLALAGWAAMMLAGLVLRFGPHLDWGRLHLLVTVGFCEGAASLLAYHSARHIDAATHRVRQHTRELARATWQLRARGHLEQHWSRRVTAEALPLLEQVADGLLDPTAPGVARHAALVEAAVRDELVLGPGNARLLAALAALRRDGWAVTSSLSSGTGRSQLLAMAHLLERVGRPATIGEVITVSAAAGRATVLVLNPSAEQCRRWGDEFRGAELTMDPDFVRIQVAPAP